MGVATVCATGCGSATLVRDGGTDAGSNGTGGHGGQGGTAGLAPTGTGGTAGGGGKTGTGGSAGGTAGTTGTGGLAGTSGTGGLAGTSGTGGLAGTGGKAGAGGGGASGSGGTGAGGTAGAGTGGTGGSACTPNASCGTTCAPGTYSCTTGTPACNQSPASLGTSCGSNLICDGSGNCVGKTADGGSCTNSQVCQNGNCAKSGSTGICCPANYANCGGSCANLQSDTNNCGSCFVGCGTDLGCSAGVCSCTANTLNGTVCFRPGQTRGTCWTGTCTLPAYFPSCNSAADCVPGGCTSAGGYCLGTVDVAGQVSCSDKGGAYVVCPASQGCSPGPYTGQVQCGDGTSTGTGKVTCDGPSDCPGNKDCCAEPGGIQGCLAQPQPGVIGSGCAAFDTNPNGPQATVVCDPLNPTTTCPAGKSCASVFGGALVSFLCQ